MTPPNMDEKVMISEFTQVLSQGSLFAGIIITDIVFY
jgi:hypothetical protein